MVVFVAGEGTCNWICKRDPANQTDADYFCLESNTRICNGPCRPCDTSLKIITQRLNTDELTGKYITSCADKYGHAIGDCNSLHTISNAHYTGNSVRIVADQHACPWECNTGFQRFEDTCKKCETHSIIICQKGEMLMPCNEGGYYCSSCTSVKGIVGLKTMETWHSLADFSDCIPDCEDGLAFKNNTEFCQHCTQQICELDELFIPCTSSQDSYCIPCPMMLEPNKEFYTHGTCHTRCVSGYALDENSVCLLCSELHCSPGYHLEYSCINEMERNKIPQCVLCDPLPNDPMRIWDKECDFSCQDGWMFQSNFNHSCVPCSGELCDEGFIPFCRKAALRCNACPLPVESLALMNMKYNTRGNCTSACISSEYILVNENYCSLRNDLIQQPHIDTSAKNPVENYGVDLLTINNDATNSSEQRVLYPTRRITHSAYVA